MKYYPQFVYCPIDRYREAVTGGYIEVIRAEEEAWQSLHYDVLANPYVLLESSGLTWRLKRILDTLGDRAIYTIYFTADSSVLHNRLSKRQASNLQASVDWLDEHRAIHYVLEHSEDFFVPVDLAIDTTPGIDHIYWSVARGILDRYIENLGL